MKIIRWLDDNLEEALLIALLVTMTLLMGLQVFSRYILNASLSWSEELTRYLFIWSGFLSISYCIKKWISIKIDQVILMFPAGVCRCTAGVKRDPVCAVCVSGMACGYLFANEYCKCAEVTCTGTADALCTGGSAGRLHACRRSRPPADRAGNR